MAVTHDGLIVTACSDKTVKVWTQEGECLHTLTGHRERILAIAVHSDGSIVMASRDHTARVWTAAAKRNVE